jgi:hypothetical protein
MEMKHATQTTGLATEVPAHDEGRTRRRRNGSEVPVRYFLLKPGTSPTKPELGQEMETEGDALIEAFRAGQPFYTVASWRAVPEVNGGNPMIVKQPVVSKST